MFARSLDEKGTAAIEFALVGPLFFLLVIGSFNLAWAFHSILWLFLSWVLSTSYSCSYSPRPEYSCAGTAVGARAEGTVSCTPYASIGSFNILRSPSRDSGVDCR